MRLQSTTTKKASWMVVPLLLCLGSVAALSAGCANNQAECPTRMATADALSPLAILNGGVHADLALLDKDLPRMTKVVPVSPTPTKHKSKPKPKPKPKSTEPHKKPPKATEPHKKSPKTTEPHKKPPPKSTTHISKDHDEPMISLAPPPKQSHKPKPKPKPHTTPHTATSHEPSRTHNTESVHPHSTEPLHPPHTTAVAPSPSPTVLPDSPTPTIAVSTGTSGENVPTSTEAETKPSPSLDPSVSPTATARSGTTVESPPAFTPSSSTVHDPSPSSATAALQPTSAPEPTRGVQTPPRPTLPPPQTTTTTEPAPKATTAAPKPPATTTAARSIVPATTTAAPSPNTSAHHSRPTKTTPWLPPTIEPVTPPKTIHTAPPGASLPDVVIPNLHPEIPNNSIKVHMRFERVSYYQVINNGILAAQLVSFIPEQLCQLLNVDCSLIMVLAIRDGASASTITSRKMKKRKQDSDMVDAKASDDQGLAHDGAAHVLPHRDAESIALLEKRGLVTTNNVADAILVTVAIPQAEYWNLNSLLTNPNSALFTVGSTNFGQFLDSTFPLSNQPPTPPDSEDGDDDGGDSTADPLTGGEPGSVVLNPGGGSSTNNGPVIGSVVGVAAIAYVGIAMFVVRRYRNKKLKEQEAAEQAKAKISAPVNVQDSSHGWGWQSS